MIKILNKLIADRKQAKRAGRGAKSKGSSFQIQKMGRFGQQLIIMSR